MDMLMGEQIAQANLSDWRKLAQGLHARYLVEDFSAGARFVAAIAEAGDEIGHHPRVAMGSGHVDFELVTDDAVYRDDDGTEYVIEWVTQQDIDLARRITELAAAHKAGPDPASVTELELGLDTADSAAIAPMWAALLTGDLASQGRGTPGDEVRDATVRVPNLWFGDAEDADAEDAKGDQPASARSPFHVEVYVAPEAVEERVAATVAAGGTVVDDSNAPGQTVLADRDGNRAVLCVDTSAVAAS